MESKPVISDDLYEAIEDRVGGIGNVSWYFSSDVYVLLPAGYRELEHVLLRDLVEAIAPLIREAYAEELKAEDAAS